MSCYSSKVFNNLSANPLPRGCEFQNLSLVMLELMSPMHIPIIAHAFDNSNLSCSEHLIEFICNHSLTQQIYQTKLLYIRGEYLPVNGEVPVYVHEELDIEELYCELLAYK